MIRTTKFLFQLEVEANNSFAVLTSKKNAHLYLVAAKDVKQANDSELYILNEIYGKSLLIP